MSIILLPDPHQYFTMELAGLVIPFLICSAFSLTLPGVGNYMLTHNSSENREALESAKKNITEGSVRVFSDEAKSIPVSSKTDDESPMEHINLEASEVSSIKDIESSERNVSGDKKSADGDRLEPDSHLRAKVPLDVFEETPVLPKLSLFEPDALWTSESKPKPLKVAVNSGVKTVYVQVSYRFNKQFRIKHLGRHVKNALYKERDTYIKLLLNVYSPW